MAKKSKTGGELITLTDEKGHTYRVRPKTGTVPPSTNGHRQADTPSSSAFTSIGTSGLKRFGGEVQEEFDPNLRGIRGVRVYDEMRRNESDVGALLYAILHICLKSTWSVLASNEGTAQGDKDAAQFLREVLFDDFKWRAYLTDAMTSNAFGWALSEIVYKQRLGTEGPVESLFDDGRIGIHKIALRGQETLDRWEFDETGDAIGMWQRGPLQAKPVFIPLSKAILNRASTEKNNPEGVSLLRPAYRPYYIKTNMEEIEVIGAERDMTGVLVISLPANAQDADFRKAREMGENYRVDDQSYFTIQKFGKEPHEQWSIDTLKTPGAKVVDTDKTIARSSGAIMRAVLAQFLMLGAGRTGSFALADSQKSLWHLAVGGRLDSLEEEINTQIVKPLFRFNTFPGMTGLPKITHTDPGELDIEKLTPFLRVLGELDMLDLNQPVIEWLHDKANLPPPAHDAAEKKQRAREDKEELIVKEKEARIEGMRAQSDSSKKEDENETEGDGQGRTLEGQGDKDRAHQVQPGGTKIAPR